MTRFEDSFHEKEHSSEETDSYRLDEPMLEIQAQLESDAKHLSELYPSMRSNQLNALVQRCEETAQSKMELARRSDVASEKTGALRHLGWTKYAISLCLGFALVFSVTLLMKQPNLSSNINPAVSQQDQLLAFDSDESSSIDMPPEFLNASQPELEAIYDEIVLVSVGVEF